MKSSISCFHVCNAHHFFAHHYLLVWPVCLSDCIHCTLLHVDSFALHCRQFLTQKLVKLLLGELFALADEICCGAHWIMGLQYTHTHTHTHHSKVCTQAFSTGRFPHLSRIFSVRVSIAGGITNTSLCRMVEDLRPSRHDLAAACTNGKYW